MSAPTSRVLLKSPTGRLVVMPLNGETVSRKQAQRMATSELAGGGWSSATVVEDIMTLNPDPKVKNGGPERPIHVPV